MSRTVLVTGATGRVGGAVVDALVGGTGEDAADVQVRAAVRDPEYASLPEGVDTVAFDFARPETWGPALDGVDALFLMRPPSTGADEVVGFAEAADRVGVDRIVYLSVLGADRNRLIPHYRVERRLESLGADHTFLRAGQFMQNLADVHAPEIRERDELFVPAGDGRMSYVDARDVGAVGAAALVVDSPVPAAYEVTGAAALDHHEVARTLTDVLGRRIEYADPSPVAFVRRMRDRGLAWGMVGVMLTLYTSARFGLGARTGDGVERALGRPPRTLREFAEDHRDAWER